ncbi:hypothetical protein BASA81_003089 [Batrachochytrium salamandrivorans]|nr:hypothetical protein BASA81_003089 [Batrachochytrium salamandrivorans]
MWTGQADYFPLNSCQNPVILDKLAWSLCALMHLRLIFNARSGFIRQWRLYQKGQQNKAKFGTSKRRQSSVLIFLAYSALMLVILPGLVGTFVARSATNLHFGVDLEITLPLVIFYAGYMVAIATIDHQLFSIMMMGAANPHAKHKTEDMIRIDYQTKLVGTFCYTCLYTACMIAAVFFPLDPGPERIVLLVLTNVGAVLYFGHYYIAYGLLISKLQGLLSSSGGAGDGEASNSKSGNGPDGNKKKNKGRDELMHVLETIKTAAEKAKRLMVMLFVVNLMFSVVPQLFAFTYVKNAMMMALATGGNHLLLTLSTTAGSSSNREEGGDVLSSPVVVDEHAFSSANSPPNSKSLPPVVVAPTTNNTTGEE